MKRWPKPIIWAKDIVVLTVAGLLFVGGFIALFALGAWLSAFIFAFVFAHMPSPY